MTLTMTDRIAGGLYGLLVGDAVGLPYEFHDAVLMPDWDQIEVEPPAGFIASYTHIPPGTWSDCGAHALALLDSLLSCGLMHPGHFASRMIAWVERGEYAVDGELIAANEQVISSLARIRLGIEPSKAAPRGRENNDNRSLTRVLPLALWHDGTDAQLISNAMTQSSITHRHLRSMSCCGFYCLWVKEVVAGNPPVDAWELAVERLCDLLPEKAPSRKELEQSVFNRVDEPVSGRRREVASTLLAVRWVLEHFDTYESVIKGAIKLGGDTCAIAGLAGGVAGVAYGVEAIPARWLSQLRGRDIVDPLLHKLVGDNTSPGIHPPF